MRTPWIRGLGLVLVLGLGAAALTGVQAQEGDDTRMKLVAGVAQAAQEAYTNELAKLDAGAGDVEAVALWSERWLEADVRAKVPAREASQAHLQRMLKLEEDMKKRVRMGAAGTWVVNVAAYHRLQAELIVNMVGK